MIRGSAVWHRVVGILMLLLLAAMPSSPREADGTNRRSPREREEQRVRPKLYLDWDPNTCFGGTDMLRIHSAIASPSDGTQLTLMADTRRTPSTVHEAKLYMGPWDITYRAEAFAWTVIHRWGTQHHTYGDPDGWQFSGSPNSVQYTWGAYPLGDPETESNTGKVKVYCKVKYAGKWYHAENAPIVLTIAGQQPTGQQFDSHFPNDRIRAIAWHEAIQSWRQFEADPGAPLTNLSDDWGAMQLNEWWLSPQLRTGCCVSSSSWHLVAWHWTTNIDEGVRYFNHMDTHFTSGQHNWSASQKTDLRTYGYHHGTGDMNGASWEEVDGDDYVNAVRGFEAEPQPWE